MVYKRGKSFWYKFRWSLKNEDGTRENFMIRRPAKVRNRNDAKDVEKNTGGHYLSGRFTPTTLGRNRR